MNIRYRVISKFVRLRKKIEGKPKLNDRERRVISIFEELFKDREADLFIAPITCNRYIVAEKSNLSVILTGDNVIISNHNYYYDISLGHGATQVLFHRFDKILESRRRKYEKEIRQNMLNSLDNIAKLIRTNISNK